MTGTGADTGSDTGAGDLVTASITPVASLKSIDLRGSPGRAVGVGVGGKMLRIDEGAAGAGAALVSGPRRAASSAMLSPPNRASPVDRR